MISRRLVDQVRLAPQLGNYKVYIIDEVHMLSASAFNAFLKTLEEASFSCCIYFSDHGKTQDNSHLFFPAVQIFDLAA